MANKVTRDQIASYLDVTPQGLTRKYEILGLGITGYTIGYNPQVTTEKYIHQKVATSSLESYQIQGDITQTCFYGDPVYDFINGLRRSEALGANAVSSVIDIDLYEPESDGSDGKYKATKHDCTIAITNYGGEDNAQIEYSIYYNGNGTEGVATVTETGVTFE